MNPRGRYAMVMYVSIRMLLPCRIVVLLSRRAVWLSSTFVTVEIYAKCYHRVDKLGVRKAYPITKSSDLTDFQLCCGLNIR
jgi:hypothetical protein